MPDAAISGLLQNNRREADKQGRRLVSGFEGGVSVLRQTKVDELVGRLVQADGSELHLKAGAPPTVRVHGGLGYLEGYEVLRPVDTESILE